MTSSRLAFVAALIFAAPALAAGDAAHCNAAKIKAIAKKTSAKLRCHAAAVAKNRSVDPACLSRAEERFSTTWAAIAAKGGCIFTGDEEAAEAQVDGYVTEVVTTYRSCGEVDGVCGGECEGGLSCFEIGVGCHGEPEPCRCHGSTTTCPPTSATTVTTTTTSSSCPTYTTTTLGVADCGGIGGPGTCFGGCRNARECVPDDVTGVCGCTGALLPCGVHDFSGACGGECPTGETCGYFSTFLPNGCPDAPRCGCVPSP